MRRLTITVGLTLALMLLALPALAETTYPPPPCTSCTHVTPPPSTPTAFTGASSNIEGFAGIAAVLFVVGLGALLVVRRRSVD